MIRKSMNSNSEDGIFSENREDICAPFLLAPAYKKYIWGGVRLSNEYGKGIPGEQIAESWECSTHENGESIVKNGKYAGKTLKSLLAQYPSMIGRRLQGIMPLGQLPVLVKLLDAKEAASVQVHPDDEYARCHENGSLGKTEMWYVLDAKDNAELIYGFHYDMEKEKFLHALERGNPDKYLQKIKVRKDDVFFIPPGCVHSVGAGIVLAEIQENSDVTYRLYDYDRIDKEGHKRELHINKAMEVLDMNACSAPRQPMRTLRYEPGCATELLCRCRYFQVERKLIAQTGEGILFKSEEQSFQILLCIQGKGKVKTAGTAGEFALQKGECLFVPAGDYTFGVTGHLTVLQIRC